MASLHQLIAPVLCLFFYPCRELDGQLLSLKAANVDLEHRNDMLSQSNARLKAQISNITIPPEEVPLGSNDSTTSNDGGGGGVLQSSGGESLLSLNSTQLLQEKADVRTCTMTLRTMDICMYRSLRF